MIIVKDKVPEYLKVVPTEKKQTKRKAVKQAPVKHYWQNATEIATYLHMSKSWVATQVRKAENPLPAHPSYKDDPTPGMTRLFDRFEVDEWVLSR